MAKVETGLALAVHIPTELGPKEGEALGRLPKLPSVVHYGTIGQLLHYVAPEQVRTGTSQCWEDTWQQVLRAMGTQSLPCALRSGKPQSKEVHHPLTSLEPTRTSQEILPDADVSSEVGPPLAHSSKNSWVLKLHPEDDVEAYLEAFEGMACTCRWPREEWVTRLKPSLSGKALLACGVSEGLSAQDYDLVKDRILSRYGVSSEKQRQCFRAFQYQAAKGPREAYKKLRTLGQRWLKPEKHTAEQILELLILEQFLTILPQEMQSWVKECNPGSCAQAVELAESFQLGKQPVVPFREVCVQFTEAEWALLSEEQRMLYCEVMLENFRNVSTLGVSLQTPELITQLQREGEPHFQEENTGSTTGGSAKVNKFLPAFKKLVTEKRTVAKKAKTVKTGQSAAMKVTQGYSSPADVVNNVLSRPETQRSSKPRNQGHTRASPRKSCPTKRQASDPQGKIPKRSKQETPLMASELASRPALPLSQSLSVTLCRTETSGKQEATSMISTTKPQSCTKRPVQQDRPPKLKKQPLSVGEPPKLRNKCVTTGKPPKLQKELLVLGNTSPGEKCQPLEEKQQSPSVKGKRQESRIPVTTWHPPFSASVLSDLTCPDCGRSFKQRADLRHHRYVHTKERPYACKSCDKCFNHPSNLYVHERTHSGERPYECLECGKAFTQSCNLRTHSLIHSGKKPYRCCYCGKAFHLRSNLTIHQRMHTGERPFACSFCPKRFRDRSTLVQHERTHTGERPYACQVCKQRFSQISHLVKHTRVHPGARGPPGRRARSPATKSQRLPQNDPK